MTREEVKRLCTIYDNLRNEQYRGAILYNSEDTFFEHVLANYNMTNHTDVRTFTRNELDGEIKNMKWEMIYKAVDWLYKQLNEGSMECGNIEKFIEDFRKAMEE